MTAVASRRHTITLLIILAVLSFASYRANASRPSGRAPNRVVLYVSVIAAEASLFWYVATALRGATLREVIGRSP
jgi:predicted secreted protein